MAQKTKKAFATSLKKLLSQRPLDKIKISDITDDCEVNRQTFYYHFKDINCTYPKVTISDVKTILKQQI